MQPHGEDGPATVDADDGDLAVGVAFDDLVTDPHECAAHGLAVEDDLFDTSMSVPLPGLTGPG